MTAPTQPTLEPILTLTLATGIPHAIGATPAGSESIVPITGGSISGPGIDATVLPGGTDVRITRADTSIAYTIDVVAELADGLIRLRCSGFRFGSTEVTAAVDEGTVVDPALYYFRGSVEVSTSVRKLAYLSRALVVTSGLQGEGSVVLDAYLVS